MKGKDDSAIFNISLISVVAIVAVVSIIIIGNGNGRNTVLHENKLAHPDRLSTQKLAIAKSARLDIDHHLETKSKNLGGKAVDTGFSSAARECRGLCEDLHAVGGFFSMKAEGAHAGMVYDEFHSWGNTGAIGEAMNVYVFGYTSSYKKEIRNGRHDYYEDVFFDVSCQCVLKTYMRT